MTRSRFTFGVLAGLAALSTAAGAQTAATAPLGSTRFATTTEQFLATVGPATTLPIVAQTANSSDKVDLVAESMPRDSWGAIKLHTSSPASLAAEPDDSSDVAGFFGTTKGRLSMVGIAGLAGAGYFAFRSDIGALNGTESPISPSTGPSVNQPGTGTVAFAENPEPATMALMVLGLGALGVVARRRRTN